MLAALSPDRKFLTLSVVNATDTDQRFTLNASGVHLSAGATLWTMTGPTLDAANHVGQPPLVLVKESTLAGAPHNFLVPPISVTIFQFPVAK